MAAILRSGKFLRIVSGFARSGPQGQQQQKNGGQEAWPSLPPIDGSSSGHAPFHAWSVQQLQSALPVLGTDHKADENLVETHDPLREFYVGKQRLESFAAAENAEEASKANDDGPVGLNVVKQLDDKRKLADKVDIDEKKSVETKKDGIMETNSLENVKKEIATTCTQTESSEGSVVATTAKAPEQSAENVTQPLYHAQNPPCGVSREAVALADHQQEHVAVTDNFSMPMVPVVGNEPEKRPDEQNVEWYPLPVVCQMFRSQGRVYDLEALLWGSQGIRPDDRKCIYFWTLHAYADAGLFPQAVDLARRLETDGLSAGFTEFHSLMDSFAMAQYTMDFMPQVVFNVPPPASDNSSVPGLSSSDMRRDSSPPLSSDGHHNNNLVQQHQHRVFKKYLASEKADDCLKAYHQLTRLGKTLNVTELSSLIELLVKSGLVQEAVDVTQSMLDGNMYPLPKIFRFLLNRLASLGEVEAMNRLGHRLASEVKKEVSFDNRLCNAYLAAGRGPEYLHMLSQDLEQAVQKSQSEGESTLSPDVMQSLRDKFPRGGAMGLLESNPELLDEYTRMALKFVDLGYVAPVNVLWTYHFINGNHDMAEPLWHAHVKTCPQIMFQKVCQTARSEANEDLAQRLVDLLEDAVVTNGARGIAYSCLLDVQTQKRSFRSGLASLKSGLDSGIQLEDVNRTAMKRLKEGLESLGEEFPYQIPKKSSNGSVCSSTPSVAE